MKNFQKKIQKQTREIKEIKTQQIDDMVKITDLKKANKKLEDDNDRLRDKLDLDPRKKKKSDLGLGGKLGSQAKAKVSSFFKDEKISSDKSKISELQSQMKKLKSKHDPELFNKDGFLH